ncbi:unnamed protein product [Porites evermanni]|uniref:Uncharacterized protein n=1 Tax=Porites evermanni TaxID=104178 RepID=A0ABN8SGW9_9CNID|nr:unnamed protein product [Porites evermanni]
MAVDSKHSALQVASLCCENQTTYPQKQGTYSWQAELRDIRDCMKINDILERRSTEIRKLYEECQDSLDECRRLEAEWFALVTEKDKNFRQQIEEENEEAKRNQMKQLYDVLIPPPPPPPPVGNLAAFLVSNRALKERGSQSHQKKNFEPVKPDPATPGNHLNEELLKRIRNGCRSELKSTPVKRSPGGTPLKRQRRMSESDTSDLITVALKRKFQHTIFHSPKESDSPRSVVSPGDIY